MSKEIIADINRYQTRVATLENGELMDLFIERKGKERVVGNIYLGRVQNVLPGMQAAFVDIGLEKNAFLYAGDILSDIGDMEFPDRTTKPNLEVNIRDVVKTGQEVLVQILKEPVGTKGARVTTHITLPGRTLVLMPTVNYIGVSKRIENEEERTRLRDIMEEICPKEMGAIVRTAARGRPKEEFQNDIQVLLKMWERIEKRAKTVLPPKVLHNEEPLVFRTIRDMFSEDVSRLVINDQDACEKLQVVIGILEPNRKQCVELFQQEEEIFDYYGLESQIERLLHRKVWLKSGGYLIIDQTEAFTVIDVNTGKYVGDDSLQETLLQANMEASGEIARQLRLRDIGGIILIDFIDMASEENRQLLLQQLQRALRKDPTKSNVVGMTKLGIVEMTRKKMRKSLSNTLEEMCPCCKGTGLVLSDESIGLKIRKALSEKMRTDASEKWLITVRESTAEYLVQTAQTDKEYFPCGYDIYIRTANNGCSQLFTVKSITDLQWKPTKNIKKI